MAIKNLYKLLIIDDHPMVNSGIANYLGRFPGFAVIGTACDEVSALALFEQWQPELILLDIDLPQGNGLDLAAKLLDRQPSCKIIIITSYVSKANFIRLKLLDIKGVFLKKYELSELVNCLNQVVNGKNYYSDEIQEWMGSGLLSKQGLEGLTATERKVLRLIAQGFTTQEIADQQCRSAHTIHKHRQNICEKLGVHGNNGLLMYVMEYGQAIQHL